MRRGGGGGGEEANVCTRACAGVCAPSTRTNAGVHSGTYFCAHAGTSAKTRTSVCTRRACADGGARAYARGHAPKYARASACVREHQQVHMFMCADEHTRMRAVRAVRAVCAVHAMHAVRALQAVRWSSASCRRMSLCMCACVRTPAQSNKAINNIVIGIS